MKNFLYNIILYMIKGANPVEEKKLFEYSKMFYVKKCLNRAKTFASLNIY